MNIIDLILGEIKPKYKVVSTPQFVYWLNHPDYPNQKWWMEFNKETMMYGKSFKLTYEYYKTHKNEFEVINPVFKVYWKEANI